MFDKLLFMTLIVGTWFGIAAMFAMMYVFATRM